MTKKQKKMAIAIARKDCKIEDKYIDDEGNTCFVGALALACKVPKKVLRKFNTDCIGTVPVIRDPIMEKFGLDEDDLISLQNANDCGAPTAAYRRNHVISVIKDLDEA